MSHNALHCPANSNNWNIEARKAFEQYDAVDARNRLAAEELERRWNEKLEEVETAKHRLSTLNRNRYSLSSEDEAQIRYMGERFGELWQSDRCPSELKKMIFRTVMEEIIVRTNAEKKLLQFTIHWKGRHSHSDRNRAAAPSNRGCDTYGGIRHHPPDGRSKW
jgi:hypothetical protein